MFFAESYRVLTLFIERPVRCLLNLVARKNKPSEVEIAELRFPKEEASSEILEFEISRKI